MITPVVEDLVIQCGEDYIKRFMILINETPMALAGGEAIAIIRTNNTRNSVIIAEFTTSILENQTVTVDDVEYVGDMIELVLPYTATLSLSYDKGYYDILFIQPGEGGRRNYYVKGDVSFEGTSSVKENA